ncbi:MAG TPA: glycosyltransferase [Thermoanaerobaculia bacterium]|nr:glycosyltransferase [Thermoanaerobaculia bacterium]
MKVLLATGRPPWPPWRGDQLRARQLAEALAPTHEVTWLAPPAAGEPPPPLGVRRETFRPRAAAWAALAAVPGLLRGWPLQALPFRQPDLGRRLRALAPRHDVVVLQLVRLLPHLRDVGDVPLVVDLIDCLSLNAATRADFDRLPLRPALRAEARRLAAAEARLISAARTALVVSERDRQALVRVAAPALAGRIAVAPIAMPEAAAAGPVPRPPHGDPTIMLTGNLGYFPNRDALRFFVAEVWPALRRAEPSARLIVAGDRPSGATARRVAAAGGTLVSRPPELRSLLAGATVAVAPLRCGSGVPLKVLDAWAAGAPVVASPFAAAGAGAEPERDLLVADSPREWVSQVGRLLADEALRGRLAAAGRARVAELSPQQVYPLLRHCVTGA